MLRLNLSRVRQNLLRWNLKRRKAGRAKREKRGLKFIPLEFETLYKKKYPHVDIVLKFTPLEFETFTRSYRF